ncbi:UNVERIFIED_CONTAM: hypothetical protein PYX00_000498 [Menopon gallinae]|uniref:Uncharacterized protein n=1 Tax=Menopon gallinae TaxID=328185 RepID=A0AAW2IA39_9NEOP
MLQTKKIILGLKRENALLCNKEPRIIWIHRKVHKLFFTYKNCIHEQLASNGFSVHSRLHIYASGQQICSRKKN